MTITPATRERVFTEQRGKCATCWRHFQSHEEMHAHHCIYTRDKRMPELDEAPNIQLLCPDCHSNHGYLSSWFGRCMAWTAKIDAGYEMAAWNESLPMLIKDSFIYLGEEKDGKKDLDKS